MKVKVYRCRTWDAVLQVWEVSKHRYTLETIASFAKSEPILDDREEVEQPDPEQIEGSHSAQILRKRRD